MVMPPSTGTDRPVMNDAASEHSQATVSAISMGLPMRFMGTTFENISPAFGSEVVRLSNRSVSMVGPGMMQLMRIPAVAHSAAAIWVSLHRPALLAP
jgi:hypothetical protein